MKLNSTVHIPDLCNALVLNDEPNCRQQERCENIFSIKYLYRLTQMTLKFF